MFKEQQYQYNRDHIMSSGYCQKKDITKERYTEKYEKLK